MKNLLNAIIVLALLLVTIQCEVVSDDLLENPNAPSSENISPDFLLNDIQINLAGDNSTDGVFQGLSEPAAEVTRMLQLAGTTYPNAFQGQDFDDEWEDAYSDILVDIQTLIPVATERQLFTHSGIARVLKAYTLVTLVDVFGDVPLSEALNPDNFNPNVDEGQAVYNVALAELDSARADLAQDPPLGPSNDLFYDGDTDAWITLANTLELKILFQQRLIADNASAINTLLNGDIINEPGEEFAFRYSSNGSNPDSRHPEFIESYLTGANEYMSNYFMNELLNGKSVADPRIRYYIYRQVAEVTTDVNEQDCINNPPPSHYDSDDPFCEDWNSVGYWGRDHGNDDGIPPDNLLRSVFGVYPAGGRFDAGQAEGVAPDQGLRGAGIQPMWMPFFTDFVRAEVELTINNDEAAARAALEDGMRKSINFVISFGESAVVQEGASDQIPQQSDIDGYVNEVLTNYDNAAGTQPKLDVLAKEFYLSAWGNGIEVYNLYRRTTFPSDFQPHLSSSPGTFYRSLTYPSAFVERNSSVEQKPDPGVKVFWDNNPDGIFDF